MSRRITLLLCTLAVVAASGTVTAQGGNNYGSVYSRFALGQRIGYSTSQADAMGVSGVALRSGLYNGTSNPAHAADQSLTTFSASGLVRGVRATDATDAQSEFTAGGLGLIQLGVPLYSNKLGLTLSYRPYSRVDYRASQEGEITVPGYADPIPYEANLEGAGGIQQVSIGLGASVNQVVSVGASLDAVLGTVENLQRTEFQSVDASFRQTRRSVATRMYGFTGTVGATATARQLAADDDALTFGAALTLPTSLSGSRATTLGTSLDRDTLASSLDGDATLPLLASAGLAYQRGSTFLASADAVYEPWSNFESSFAFGGYSPTGTTASATLSDRLRVGAGVEWTPAGARRQAPYVRQVSYRLGGYVENGFVDIDGEDLFTRALTGGLSLPTRLSGARIDLGFEVGTRGETTGVRVQDLFWRGTFTLNFGERWFVRRRLG